MEYAGYQAHYVLDSLEPPNNKLEVVQFLPENITTVDVAEQVLRMRAETLARVYDQAPEQFFPADVQSWQQRTINANYLVALAPDQPDRFAGEVETNFLEASDVTLVTHLGVLPCFWGQGIGTRLLHAALRQKEYPDDLPVNVFTAADESTNNWYENLGFRCLNSERGQKEIAVYQAASLGGIVQALEKRIYR